MHIREQLYTIPDLLLTHRLPMMTRHQVSDYIDLLNSFVETLPAEEAALRAAMEAGNSKAVILRLTGIRDMLTRMHADELADECWKRLNRLAKSTPEKMEAYISFLLAMLTALSIDIQMAFAREEENDTAPAASSEQADAKTIKTILAVDDDTYCLDTFKAALKDVSCKIIGATSGSSALHMLQNITPDLFVLDIEMPEMNGIELANEIRKLGKTSPIIFVTGNGTKEYVQRCIQAGASDFIVKSINPQGVVARIKKFL